jgi:carbonic anhydrase
MNEGRRPAKKLAIVACMDARVDPAMIMGLERGDAHVIRNAGGVITEDAIRSLAISQSLLGTEEILLIHHTDCGMAAATDDEIKSRIEDRTGHRPHWHPEAIGDLDQSVRDSIAKIKENPYIPVRDSVRGFVYDVETGELREV